jgi:hypothetical protein
MIRALALSVLLVAAPAAAQDATRARGLMQATTFEALPARAAVAVRPPDGSQASTDIAAVFVAALARLGHPADPGAAHQLMFRIGDVLGVNVERPPDIELRGSLGAGGHDDAELVMRLQMLDRPETTRRTRTRLIVVEVVGRGSGPVWEARIEASGAADDDDVALAEALIPGIMARLGQDAYNLPIPELDR